MKKLNKASLFILKLLISSSLLYIVLSRTDIEKVFILLKEISPIAFISAVLIHVISQFLSSLRWRLLLPEGFGVGRLFSLYLIGSFFSTFLPGSVGGDAVKAYYLYKEKGMGFRIVASVFMDRYIGFISLMTIGLIAFPFGYAYFRGSWVEWLLPLTILCFIMVSIIIFGLRIGSRFRAIRELYEHFHSYRKNRALIAKALLLSALLQAMIIISVYILSLGIGQDIKPMAFFVFLPIIATLSAIPISISGIGIREASFVLLLGFLDIKPDVATAISFAWFLSIAAGGLIGLFEYLRHKGSITPKGIVADS